MRQCEHDSRQSLTAPNWCCLWNYRACRYKLIDRFVNELLGCGYLPLNPFPLFAQQALIAETQLAMQQRSFAELLRIPEKYPPPEPRGRFELEHPSPDSPLSTIFVTAKGNDLNRFEVGRSVVDRSSAFVCGWSLVLALIGCHAMIICGRAGVSCQCVQMFAANENSRKTRNGNNGRWHVAGARWWTRSIVWAC